MKKIIFVLLCAILCGVLSSNVVYADAKDWYDISENLQGLQKESEENYKRVDKAVEDTKALSEKRKSIEDKEQENKETKTSKRSKKLKKDLGYGMKFVSDRTVDDWVGNSHIGTIKVIDAKITKEPTGSIYQGVVSIKSKVIKHKTSSKKVIVNVSFQDSDGFEISRGIWLVKVSNSPQVKSFHIPNGTKYISVVES